MGSPVVVVVPCYNERPERIERSVTSALAVAGVDLVRVVDDGSAVPVNVEPRDRLEVLRCEHNGGPSAALNAGIRPLPDDAIVVRLDVGDVFYAEPKARQIEMAKAGAPAVASWHFDPVHNRVHKIRDDWQTMLFATCQFSSTATVFTRAAWLEAGCFDESMRWADDWVFLCHVQAYVGWTVLAEVTGEHGEHPGGHSDVKHDPEKKRRRLADQGRAARVCRALGNPEKHAHLFSEAWAAKRGLVPMRRPKK